MFQERMQRSQELQMPTGELVTRWTVRAALALYVLGLALRVRAGGRRPKLGMARWFWTAGCLAFLLHTASAFQFYHHWSHRAAYEATARQTAEVVGLDWGSGLYANYGFAALWTADVCWWWFGRERYLARPRGLEWAVQGFLGFMAFNATVVFGAGAIRWTGLAASLFLAAVLAYTGYCRGSSLQRSNGRVEPTAAPDRGRE
jgi:hypothetical protein